MLVLIREVSIFDINRGSNHANPARAQLFQIIGREHVRAVALLVQIHEHVEMKIDNPVGVKPVDSLFQ